MMQKKPNSSELPVRMQIEDQKHLQPPVTNEAITTNTCVHLNINSSEFPLLASRKAQKQIDHAPTNKNGSTTTCVHLHLKKELHQDLRDLAHARGLSITQVLLNSVHREIDENIVQLTVYRQNKQYKPPTE